MITQNTLSFLKDLSENNNRAWFEQNKQRYLEAHQNMEDFMSELITQIRKIEPIYEKDSKKYVYRIYRDLRFSKDKTPYKTFFSGLIERSELFQKCPFYISIEPNKSMIGGGSWQPEPKKLLKIRQYIDKHGDKLEKILKKPTFKKMFGDLQGETLKRHPLGFSVDSPYIDFLKHKDFTVGREFSNAQVTSTDFIKLLVDSYREVLPFFHFFDNIE